MRVVAVVVAVVVVAVVGGELLQNTGLESNAHWDCWGFTCHVTNDHHSGSHAILVSDRRHVYDGPSQYINVESGHTYTVSGYMRLTCDHNHGQDMQLEVDFQFTDNQHQYVTAASKSNIRISDGWVHLTGSFTAPNRALSRVRIYFQGPDPGCNFIADDASVVEGGGGGGITPTAGTSTGAGSTSHISSKPVDSSIDKLRRSDINVAINLPGSINKNDLKIRVLQTKKSFPFGTCVAAGRYNDPNLQGYRDFIHQHFNWAVPENALKWPSLEPNRGNKNYQPALDMIKGLRSHGIKVRGHNLVWSVDQWIQGWVKQLRGSELRQEVEQHIQETTKETQGLLEHWDVNNENLHGQWFQNTLNDPDYDLELFRLAHKYAPGVKLFLNDYNVVAAPYSTNDYLKQAQRVKAANVGLYGLGCQGHFGDNEEPDVSAVRQRLDTLAQAGLPIWITELDVQSNDANKRADFYEKALTAVYGHPSVEGILIWGFWDQAHWRGSKAALVDGNNFQINAAGRRFLDLLENQWMTDETVSVADHGNSFTVRGFHGDYELQVIYQGRQLSKTTFTLGKTAHTESVDVSV